MLPFAVRSPVSTRAPCSDPRVHRLLTGDCSMKRWSEIALALLMTASLLAPGMAGAEVAEVRVGKIYGIAFLPLYMMQDRQLLEKHLKAAGLDTKVSWATYSNGAVMNDSLLAGSVEIASGGIPPFVLLWARTRGTPNEVKAISAKAQAPIFLNTRNPNIKSIRDFTEKDRIAIPAPKVSGQAIILQMALQKEYGKGQEFRLDNIQVAMSSPDGMIALLTGKAEITAHFTDPPFQYQELKQPGITRVLKSFDVLGGPTTYNVIWTTDKFHRENPKTYAAFLAAMREAVAEIYRDKRAAAEVYIRQTKEKVTVEELLELINNPEIEFTLTPKNMGKIVSFMNEVGLIKIAPQSWKDLFFPEVHDLPGS